MATMHTEERIGEAWRLHREGDNKAAIKIYEDILSKTPDNIDAHYGLGLARRVEGDSKGAIEAFKRALDLSRKALEAVNVTSVVDGHTRGNDLDTYEDDRYLMLQRMLEQRLEEMGVSKSEEAEE